MKLEVYIVHNGYISHIVSCNSSQNFEFVKLVIFRTRMHLKFEQNLIFTITLENMRLHH